TAPNTALQPTPKPLGCQITRVMVSRKINDAISIRSSLQKSGEKSAAANWPISHRLQTCNIAGEPFNAGGQRPLQQSDDPGRQLWVQPIKNPLPLTTVRQQPVAAQ